MARCGREALCLAGEGAFDLLLLDVPMPELDGFQVVQAVRARERTTGGHLPIIALPARSRKEDRARCLAGGMDDFLDDLFTTLEECCRRSGKLYDHDPVSPSFRSLMRGHPGERTMRTWLQKAGLRPSDIKSGKVTRRNYAPINGN